ncbi:ADP-ribosylation factor-like protein 2-binding protein [Nematostella vectensis]|uniref:ADP-ribosylation factor-like protein 2-binding protein n=1 Tax=Nematostella vectensis TaxID=45351 RepID=UPI00207772A5|nr:ADP-ribosylation factor-like protein 2-binding protein [Nematostella vectensis]
MAGLHPLNMEENLAVGRSSSRSDKKFDTTVGHLEDIIMEESFQTIVKNFMEEHYQHFEDTEENKLIYTDIFKEYVNKIEKYIDEQLHRRMQSFNMEEFMKNLQRRPEQIDGDIYDILISFTDFLAFKQTMLDYKAEKEGTAIDFSDLMTVRSSIAGCESEEQEMQIDPDSPTLNKDQAR